MVILKVIQSVGGFAYDLFYILGKFATIPINQIIELHGSTYVNPFNNSTVTIQVSQVLTAFLNGIVDFFDKNLIFTYSDTNITSNMTLLSLVVVIILAVALIKTIVHLIAVVLP